MGAFTVYGRKLLLEGLFITPVSIGNTWVAITFVVPGTADDSSRLVEPVVGGYARAPYAFASGWEAGQPGEIWNKTLVTFPTPSADWGTIRGWALCSAVTAGHVIAAGGLRQPTAVRSGTPIQIAAHGIRAVLR